MPGAPTSQPPGRLRARRLEAGLSQAQLADAAGVSRALVGAVESGRHLPSVDAALRLAQSLDVTVEELFSNTEARGDVHAVLGERPPDGALVWSATVGEQHVVHPLPPEAALGAVPLPADAVMRDGGCEPLTGAPVAGAVVAGCEPLLQIAAAALAHRGPRRIVPVATTSGEARVALRAGRCHAAMVHGPAARLRRPRGVRAWHVARWRSGLAVHDRHAATPLDDLLTGAAPTVERAPSAASQRAVDDARNARGIGAPAPGLLASGHIEACRAAAATEGIAPAPEPIALILGLRFLPLEQHRVELWVDERFTADPAIETLIDLLTSSSFQRRAATLPAYDLTDTGAARR